MLMLHQTVMNNKLRTWAVKKFDWFLIAAGHVSTVPYVVFQALLTELMNEEKMLVVPELSNLKSWNLAIAVELACKP